MVLGYQGFTDKRTRVRKDKEMEDKKTIKHGNHVYEIKILNTRNGMALMHEYTRLLGAYSDQIFSVVGNVMNDIDDQKIKSMEPDDLWNYFIDKFSKGDDSVLNIIKLLSEVLTVPRLFELCAMLFDGATIDGEKCDEEGLCSLFRKKIHEAYVAIAWAIVANYGDYFPFLSTEEGTTEDHSPSKEEAKKE
jgi:hypothetical protein